MDLKLGEATSLIIFYNIAISWLHPPNGFQFNFLLRGSASQVCHSGKLAFPLRLQSAFYPPLPFLAPRQPDKKMALSPCLSTEKLLTLTVTLISNHTTIPSINTQLYTSRSWIAQRTSRNQWGLINLKLRIIISASFPMAFITPLPNPLLLLWIASLHP